MLPLFEIVDKTGRKIRLTNEQARHILHDHPDVNNFEEIHEALGKPFKIIQSPFDSKVAWYMKQNKLLRKYLLVAVKYLNGDGFIITAFYMRNMP